jgi:energy-coupling factor transporter ATP-binding protein EcfA2
MPAGFCSPGVLLASFSSQGDPPNGLFLVCGPSGAGKTTWLGHLAILARDHGYTVGGLLSPAVFENENKVAIELLDLASGQRRLLARPRPKASPGQLGWAFEPTTLEWGNRVLAAQGPCDCLLLDELGPLEWRQAAGLQGAFACLERADYRAAFVSIRPALLAQAVRRWPEALVVELKAAYKPQEVGYGSP